jgi:heme exporter protein C
MHAKGLRGLAAATLGAGAAATGLIFVYAPTDADQGFVQKIFYLHVPMAIVALCGFVAAAVMAIKYVRSGDRAWDVRSYVAIHLSIILGVGVLATGSIWAKASWGHWWVWDEPTLVSFLIVFLLYCTYQPLRFAIEDPSVRPATPRCSRSRRARSCRSTSSPFAWPRPTRIRGCCRRRADTCLRRCGSHSSWR